VTGNVAAHLGIIPDGIRRWARLKKVPFERAYWTGMKTLIDILEAAFSQGVVVLSVYLLSRENLARKKNHLNPVLWAEERLMRELLPAFCTKWNCRPYHAGLPRLLPPSYADALAGLGNLMNSGAGERKLYLLVAYNPWDELQHAINASPNPSEYRNYLWVRESVDLVIRSGHVHANTLQGVLLSNFLPLQSGYAEFLLIPKLFNDVTPADIEDAIAGFPSSGFRKFGK